MEVAMHAGPYLRWGSVSKLLIAETMFIALPGGDQGQRLQSTLNAGVAGTQAAAAEVGILDSLSTTRRGKAAAGACNCWADGFQRGLERGDLL